MFSRIMTGIDGTQTSVRVLAEALRFASQEKAVVLVVSVLIPVSDTLGPGPGFGDTVGLSLTLKARAQVALSRAKDLFILAGVEGETRLIDPCDQDIAAVLLNEAARWQADLIVLGTHSRHGLERLLVGSTTVSCLRASHVPILVIPPESCRVAAGQS
ncbi:universal stress protein [Paraburkholderia heleia]|uniref:universal stress protein n=1 Tax=Paraburkholderia heleia TaxID=634127 RepID=UPI002AB6D63E|nr:universal stress protein [Paraburkholderia heleia]